MSTTKVPSLKSSIGSKSSGRAVNLYHSNKSRSSYRREETKELLKSSWIRRLRWGPNSPSPPPSSPSNPEPEPSSSVHGHRNSVSTHESRTPTSSKFKSSFAENRKEREKERNSGSLVSGFGPFRVRNRRGFLCSAAANAATPSASPSVMANKKPLEHQNFRYRGSTIGPRETSRQQQQQDPEPDLSELEGFGLLGQESEFNVEKVNCINKHYDREVCFSFSRQMAMITRFGQEGENSTGYDGIGESNLVHLNSEKLIAGKRNLVVEGRRFGGGESSVSSLFSQGRVRGEDNPGSRLSSFFQFRPCIEPMEDASGKYDNMRESRDAVSKGKCFINIPKGEASNKLLESEFTANNSDQLWPVDNRIRCSSSSRSQNIHCDIPEQRLCEKRLSTDPRQTDASAVPGIKSLIRSRGTTYHDNADGTSAGRSFRDTHLIQQHERQDPTSDMPKKNFAFYRTESFERAKDISSAFPAISVSRSSGRKRNPQTETFFSAKSRKLGAGTSDRIGPSKDL